jgi:hypothetical protein
MQADAEGRDATASGLLYRRKTLSKKKAGSEGSRPLGG